jgi:mannitol/fructose-specific phosphotransferase system IIA component (Ntr-type)
MMTVPAGIDFDAIDGNPCRIFLIVVGPDEDREGYLKLLSQVSRLFKQESVRKAVVAAKAPSDLLKTLKAAEA